MGAVHWSPGRFLTGVGQQVMSHMRGGTPATPFDRSGLHAPIRCGVWSQDVEHRAHRLIHAALIHAAILTFAADPDSRARLIAAP